MFTFDIIHHPESFSIQVSRIKEILYLFSTGVNIQQVGILNIAFIDGTRMQELNFHYRKKNAITDVLSFHYFDDFSSLHKDDIVGELLFSESQIIAQANEYAHSPQEEFEILFIHSVLHILGYDHETDEDFEQMFLLEKEIRKKMGLNIAR